MVIAFQCLLCPLPLGMAHFLQIVLPLSFGYNELSKQLVLVPKIVTIKIIKLQNDTLFGRLHEHTYMKIYEHTSKSMEGAVKRLIYTNFANQAYLCAKTSIFM